MLSGDNSILSRATDAKTKSDEAQIQERVRLAYNSALARDLTNGNGVLTKGTLDEEINNEFGTDGNVTEDDDYFIISVKGKEIEKVAKTKNAKDANDKIAEVATENIANTYLKDTSKIKAVLKGEAEGSHEIPIPVGATYVEGTENTGVVIRYKESEFVWVPVPIAISDTASNGTTNKAMAINAGTEAEPKYRGLLYDFDSNTKTSSVMENCTSESNFSASDGTGGSGYREIDILSDRSYGDWSTNSSRGYALIKANVTEMAGKNNSYIKENWLNQLQGEYNEMVASVAKYGGFFVGRYETSYNGTQVASKLSTDSSVVMPMTAETTSGNTWYGMYDKQRKFAGKTTNMENNSDIMQSSMIYGSQYDAMLNWMLKGSETTKAKLFATTNGNHNNTNAVGCGTYGSGSDLINNIYDLEGNVYEFTQEACYTNCHAIRGCSYYYSSTPVDRNDNGPSYTDDSSGSRLALYIK